MYLQYCIISCVFSSVTFLRKVFGLPFLPADHIPPAFEKLKEKSTDEKTQEIMQY
jgi:hypothetical protein